MNIIHVFVQDFLVEDKDNNHVQHKHQSDDQCPGCYWCQVIAHHPEIQSIEHHHPEADGNDFITHVAS